MPIDRHLTSELLSFTAPTENAMDTVSDRDYSLEFLSDASISMMHLSRWAEEFAWWNSSEFSYIVIDDSFCTGSSIMPQKKNPDMAELIRGKRILLVDDVISTGGSLHAMEELVKLAGGTVTGRAAVLAEGDARTRTDIKFLAPLPVFNADGSIKE